MKKEKSGPGAEGLRISQWPVLLWASQVQVKLLELAGDWRVGLQRSSWVMLLMPLLWVPLTMAGADLKPFSRRLVFDVIVDNIHKNWLCCRASTWQIGECYFDWIKGFFANKAWKTFETNVNCLLVLIIRVHFPASYVSLPQGFLKWRTIPTVDGDEISAEKTTLG